MLKSKAELNKLEPDSPDVFKLGMIERYVKRPESMESVCLADFIACYNFKGKGKSSSGDEGEADTIENIPAGEIADLLIEDELDEDAETSGPTNKIKLDDGTLTRRKSPKVIRFCRFDVRREPVEFFRERLMLFKPWRNEQTELENVNHEIIYRQHQTLIESNSTKYIKLDVNFDEIFEAINREQELEETSNMWDDEADPDFVNVYEPDENVPEPNILFDVGQDAQIQLEAKKYTVPDMVPTEEYLDICDSLNEKQRDYLMHVLHCFKTGKNPVYHFISGGAGVGKSRLIKAVYQSLVRYFRKDAGPAGNPEILLVAPTGKAAYNINGVTAHYAFNLKFGTNSSSEEYTPPSAETLNTMRTKLCELKAIIIDEISMLGTSTFQKIHFTLNSIFKNNDPNRIFGGVSVIVLGDFNQLRPVKDDFCFMPSNRNPLNVLAGRSIWDYFKMFELTQIMRQREDTAFAEALNRLAVGSSTDEDITMFKSRLFTEENLPEEAKNTVRLAWTNDEVEKYNMKRVQQISASMTEEDRIISKAVDILPKNISNQEKAQILRNLKDRPTTETQGLPETLVLQKGVHYMVSSNIDVEDGLCNGAIGILRKFQVEPNTNTVLRVFLEFEDPKVGRRAKNMYNQNQPRQVQNETEVQLVPIVPSKLSFAVTKKHHNQVRNHFNIIFVCKLKYLSFKIGFTEAVSFSNS